MAMFDPVRIWHHWLRHRPKWSRKFWVWTNFRGLRYIYQKYYKCCVFSFFPTIYALRHGYSLNSWTDFYAQFLKRARWVLRSRCRFNNTKIMISAFKRLNLPFCAPFKMLTGIFSKTVRNRDMVSIDDRSRIRSHIWAFEWYTKIWPHMIFREQRSRWNPARI